MSDHYDYLPSSPKSALGGRGFTAPPNRPTSIRALLLEADEHLSGLYRLQQQLETFESELAGAKPASESPGTAPVAGDLVSRFAEHVRRLRDLRSAMDESAKRITQALGLQE